MDWLDSGFIYIATTSLLDSALDQFLGLFTGIMQALYLPVIASVAIYLALTGYSVMTGVIAMTPRDLAIRFAKAIGIIVLIQIFAFNGASIFTDIWSVTDGIADFYVEKISGVLALTGSASIDTLDALAALFTIETEVLGALLDQAHEGEKWGMYSWLMVMVPLALLIIAVYIAKFVVALLFMVSPLVFILSMVMGNVSGNNILASWFKMIITTLLTLIFVYIVGITIMFIMTKYIALLGVAGIASIVLTGSPDITMIHLAPLGILSLFSIILMTQATTVASGIMGIAATNTQQATSFMQIGALRSASG